MTNGDPPMARILVVDDNRQIVDVLRLGLRACSFDVLTATNGQEAINRAINELPDLILLDVMMPVMGGHEVCAILKDESRTRDIPIIFVSACTEVPDRVQGLELGAVDYVTKPFDMNEVASRVRAALRTRARQVERTQDLDRLKSDFVHLLTHEIATPLTAIQGFSELLEMGLSHMSPNTQMDCLRAINQSSRRLSGAMDDFLCLAQSGGTSPPGSASLPKIIQEQIDELAGELADSRHTVVVEPTEADLPAVASHPRFLPRAVYHLLSNAFKFSPAGSTLRVKVAREAGQVTMEVSDCGPGISADLREKVFERFYQVDPSKTRPYAGMGIGLAVARTLARALCGDVIIRSSTPEGSVFVLSLPPGPGGNARSEGTDPV